MTAKVTSVGPRCRLTILSGGAAVWSCTCWPRLSNLLLKDVPDFTAADPEDFDFGLMVSNVLRDPRRFDRMSRGR